MSKCELRKRFEWCPDLEPQCSAIISRLGVSTEDQDAWCKLLSLNLLPKYRYLKYIDNLVNVSHVTTEQILVLKQLGLSNKDIGDLLNTKESTVKERLAGTKRNPDGSKELLSHVVDAGTKNALRSLESKWLQLSEMRKSVSEDVQLKAIKLQVEIEGLIGVEKDRVLSMDRLKSFMSMMEDKVITADRRLRNELERVNRVLTRFGEPAIEYVSITKDIRRAIEADSELQMVDEVIANAEVIEVSTERTTQGEQVLID